MPPPPLGYNSSMRTIFSIFRRYFLLIIIVVVLAALAAAYELGRASVYRAYPELSSAEQATAVLAKVSALIQLPSGETPTIASITDAASASKTQPFLANAQNGDILIVYAQAKTAYLYRPSTNKLIAVGPIASAPAQQAAAPTPTSNASTSTTTHK